MSYDEATQQLIKQLVTGIYFVNSNGMVCVEPITRSGSGSSDSSEENRTYHI